MVYRPIRASAGRERTKLSLADWIAEHPDRWSTDGTSARLRAGTSEWTELRCPAPLIGQLAPSGHALVEAVVSGNAEAAGISFGPFKDFLVSACPEQRDHLIQLEVERQCGWRLRINGGFPDTPWWTSAARTAADLWDHELRLKARHASDVRFDEVSVLPLAAKPTLSVIITCNRFSQRLRAALQAWACQDCESGSIEAIVVGPAGQDAAYPVVLAAAASFPWLRVGRLEVSPETGRNKGAMINRAIQWARGEWVLLTDADCLFPYDTMATVQRAIDFGKRALYYGERRHLSLLQTQAILAGLVDPADPALHKNMRTSAPSTECSPDGYSQLVPRDLLERVRYRENLDHFAHTDRSFVADCRTRGVKVAALESLACLHLTHPFSWYGTELQL